MTATLPETMACIRVRTPGGPEVLEPARAPVPRPGPGEVLIRVAAAGVNRVDTFQRLGRYPVPPGASDRLGLEVAGEIAAVGTGVAGWKTGENACALLAGGGYAEYATAPAAQCLPIPRSLNPVQAASLPECVFTVWTNVFDRASLKTDETFLVHGGSSGIGVHAIQMARAWGARVIATAGSAHKCEACLALGAERAVDYKVEDFVTQARDWTAGRGLDVILDMVGGDYVQRNIEALGADGRLVSIAFLKGSRAEVDLRPMMAKRLTITGSTLRPLSPERKAAIAAAVRDHVWPWIESGRVRPVIEATFPLARAADAHRLMESSAHIGKIMLVP